MNSQEVFVILKSNSEDVCNETIRLLVKIADNIIQNPKNRKVRTLLKDNSTVRDKILAVRGGRECLKLLGFQESETGYVLPCNSPLTKLEIARKDLLIYQNAYKDIGANPKKNKDVPDIFADHPDLKNVKEFVSPPLKLKFHNPFLQRIERQFHDALRFGDKECQKRAKELIPLDELEISAQNNLRHLQIKVKKEHLDDPEFTLQDMLLLELLTWFKTSFFSWVDTPNCEICKQPTVMSHMSEDPKDFIYTSRVEVYKCHSCSRFVKFPRYNDLNILLETRRGRCGEWAQVFTLLCRSLDWDARYVIDELDHVWTEVYSQTQKRWLHCDPCENACDTPLMYETGWKKKLSYVIAYSPEEVQDVTWRYSGNHREVISRRKYCAETDLVNALISLRKERQKSFHQLKQEYLTKRLVNELVEFLSERQPQENEKLGRISGSKEWRVARGESKNEDKYVWIIEDKHIINDKLTIRYSAARDWYEFVKGDSSVIKVHEWGSGVKSFTNVFRKEEKDWKVAYLARTEGTDTGVVVWKFQVDSRSKKVIDKISINIPHQTYEDGEVIVQMMCDGFLYDFADSSTLESTSFSGADQLTIKATFTGGKGHVAWQHAQLFRQNMNDTAFPFVVSLTFTTL